MQIFSGWRRVCGSPSQGGRGKYSHWRRCVCVGALSLWCRDQQDDSHREEAVPEPAGPETEDPVMPPRGEEGKLRHLFASMVGSEEPVMRWAVFTTLCSLFRSATEQLRENYTEMQLVRMLSMVQR